MTNAKKKALSMLSGLKKDESIHLSGIAGSAMCGLALLLRQRGFEVTGTDPRADQVRELLGADGVVVSTIQDGSKIPVSAGLMVATAALPVDHPELNAAHDRGLPVLTYAEFLGVLMDEREGIAVAGTHGKTTTTTMIAFCLRCAGLEPGFVIGGHSPDLGTSSDNGSSNLFVAEACEYNRSFHHLRPKTALILNIEEDHLDIYHDLDGVKRSFIEFVSNLEPGGQLIYSAHCENTASIMSQLKCDKVSFGVQIDADFEARNVREDSGTVFDLVFHQEVVSRISLSMPGFHNVSNALAAAAACHSAGVPFDQVGEALSNYNGVKRRFEVYGDFNGITLVDDYAHHPTELKALLEGARSRYKDRRIVVVFQPHQCSRTAMLLESFATSFDDADLVVVPDIYSVRDSEEDKKRIHSRDLVAKIAGHGKRSEYIGKLKEVADYLITELRPGDVLITAGAGDVDLVISDLQNRL